MNTGVRRTLMLVVEKKIANVTQPGYPLAYQGRNAFSYNENVYPEISIDELADLSDENYISRLADFKLYIQQLESGLNIDSVQTNLPYEENTTACPIL